MLKRVFSAIVLACVAAGPAVADPAGVWLDKDNWTIRIHACGQALCAEIASTQPPLDPATGKPWTDKNNADAAKRERPLVGVPVLFDMQPNGPGKWSGTLYDPDRGKMYSGNLIELGADRIRIEGCMLVLCGGEELRRVSK
ncbi:MAG: DUF2147 domain-containing protein [Alphaproteobacteria bacterium]|nr:MAG: DUF2147 domain-containing protein [Alphaproteobacteria bacterium]